MREVVERNRAETASNVCHSHDFCDANMVFYEILLQHDMERHRTLWDQAWSLAKSRDFGIAD